MMQKDLVKSISAPILKVWNTEDESAISTRLTENFLLVVKPIVPFYRKGILQFRDTTCPWDRQYT